MQKSIAELQHLQTLLQMEREEEIRQYKAILQNVPIAERRRLGLSWYPIAISNIDIGIGEQLVITIEPTTPPAPTDAPHKFQQGQTAGFFVVNTNGLRGTQLLTGVIKQVKHNSLDIVVTTDELPEWMDDGKLGLDLLYNEVTFQEMDFALKKLIEAKGNRIAELREILLGYAEPYFEVPSYIPDFAHLNPTQAAALQKVAVARDLAIIHGPPGTGKTTTLVQAILHTLHEQKQVLVCAPSNTAVDLLTEKLVEANVKVVRMGHPARVNERLHQFSFESQVTQHSLYVQMKKLRRQALEQQQKARKYKRSFGDKERQERREALADARKMLDEAANIEKFILRDVLDSAQVITATLAGSASALLRHKQFETVFIDEAGQALAPATWIPILRSRRVVLAGDHCQLPPTVKLFEAERRGLGISLFEQAIYRLPQAATTLKIQYRMHQNIMQYSNEQFYDQQLQAHESVAQIVLGTGHILSSPFDFIDTAGSGYEEESSRPNDTEGSSKQNPQEGALLLQYLDMLLDQTELEWGEERTKRLTIGLISPYKAQANWLRSHLDAYSLLQKYSRQISVHTVDGFQGQERDIIGISLVRSNHEGEIGFLKDTRRMNVALTRAKRKLIVVGDSATIANHDFYAKMLSYVEHHATYKTVWELIY